MSHPLPPLPPEALESENAQQESVVPTRASYELSPDIQEMSRSVQELTNATNHLALQGQSPPSVGRSSKEFSRALRENNDADSIGHESTGGRSRSSKEYTRSPNKLSKQTRKEVPAYDEFMPPPRISSRTHGGQANGSPASTTRRSLDQGQDFAPTAPTGYGTVSTQAGSINASPRPRPARTAPLEEPINSREVPERRPRSQYPDGLQQHARTPSQSQPSINSAAQLQPHPPQSQSQQWGPPPNPRYQDDREFLAGEGDGFYGNTGNAGTYPYGGPYNDSAMYGQGEPRHPSPALLDQSHLQPGVKAALLSNEQSLALYRANAKKSSNPEMVFEFAAFMLEASKSVVVPPADATYSNQLEIDRANEKREGYIKEAMGLLKKIADRGHVLAQYTLADCYSNGIGTIKGRQDFDRAFPLFVAAAKHNHVDAAYRAGACCEYGWGCRKDSAKAAHFYRAAASQGHPGAMFRLGQAEMNGELGLPKNAKEGVRWLQRSAENATAEFPHALHELALCHEKGVHNVIFVDLDYAAELLGQASELGYAPSAYRLGEAYEYGNLGCQPDPALTAQQNHREACFSLTAWYLVGSPGVLPQSDTEAFLWAKRAADAGLAKAQYAVGYFYETGIGTPPSLA
ncbi:15317_t:CDS:2, partial [Acaulospora colombiana]